jgi:hypothetical protein
VARGAKKSTVRAGRPRRPWRVSVVSHPIRCFPPSSLLMETPRGGGATCSFQAPSLVYEPLTPGSGYRSSPGQVLHTRRTLGLALLSVVGYRPQGMERGGIPAVPPHARLSLLSDVTHDQASLYPLAILLASRPYFPSSPVPPLVPHPKKKTVGKEPLLFSKSRNQDP